MHVVGVIAAEVSLEVEADRAVAPSAGGGDVELRLAKAAVRLAQLRPARLRPLERGWQGGDGGGRRQRIDEYELAAFVGADRIEQRETRRLPVVLRDEQRLARPLQLNVCLCDVEPRAGSGLEFVLRHADE